MKNLLTIILLMVTTYSFAQDYRLTYVYRQQYFETTYQLNITDKLSLWREIEMSSVRPGVKHPFDEIIPTPRHEYNFHFVIVDESTKSISSDFVYFGTPLYIKDPMTEISWSIQDSTAKVLGMDCQVATCSRYGRDYTAYFTTQIPIPKGPWKLYGLPGLILKVETEHFTDIDFKEKIVIECVKVEKAPLSKKELKFISKQKIHKYMTYKEAVSKVDKYIKVYVENFKRSEAEESPEEYQGLIAKRQSHGQLDIIHQLFQSTGVEIWAD